MLQNSVVSCSLLAYGLARAQGYAWEITTPEGGWGLDRVLQSRQHVLNGITNGIDMQARAPCPFSHALSCVLQSRQHVLNGITNRCAPCSLSL